jgi:hypothetical protein
MIGCLLAVSGLLVIGLTNYLFTKKSEAKDSSLLSYIVILFGVLFTGLRYVY